MVGRYDREVKMTPLWLIKSTPKHLNDALLLGVIDVWLGFIRLYLFQDGECH